MSRGSALFSPGLIELAPTGREAWLAFSAQGFLNVTGDGVWVQYDEDDEGPYSTDGGTWWWRP